MSNKLYKQIIYITDESEYSIMSMFIEISDSRVRNVTVNSCCKFVGRSEGCVIYIYIQGPPKKCIHTLTKENSSLYNRLL